MSRRDGNSYAGKKKEKLKESGFDNKHDIILGMSFCNDNMPIEKPVTEDKSETESFLQIEQNEAEPIIELGQDLYEKAYKDGIKNDLETIRNIVMRFGEEGH